MQQRQNNFRRINLLTIIAVYFLILVGGIVRSMEAGMGCPDWPKCFGSYIPPASVEELPQDYPEIYKQKRIEKNLRLSKVLSGMGFNEISEKVLNDPNVSENTTFSPSKAWTEYVNRLVGVAIGILVILNMYFSFKTGDKTIKVLGVASFVLVVFQGWIGSLVVSTNLLPGFITFHMILALLLVALLLWQYFKVDGAASNLTGGKLITIILVLFTLQVVFGTQVREQVDLLHDAGLSKDTWVDNLGLLFYIHRSYSLLLTALIGYFVYVNKDVFAQSTLMIGLVIAIIAEIVVGAIATYFSFPAFTQPTHLLLGAVAFGLIFYLFLKANFKALAI